MQRSFMRFVGRLTVAGLLALIVIAIVSQPQQAHHQYMAKYDQFRNMLRRLRIVDLSPSNYIEGLFDILRHVDTVYLSMSGLLIILGVRLGPWMLVSYLILKSLILYIPVLIPLLIGFPKVLFISRDAFDMMRHFALLGSALALTYSVPKQQVQEVNVQPEKVSDE